MEPGIPFPLLAGVELFTAAALFGLAGVACTRPVRSTCSPVLVPGALVLVAAEAVTAFSPGGGSSSALLWTRAAGFLLITLGLLPTLPWPTGPWPTGPRPTWPRAGSAWRRARTGAGGAGGASLAVVIPIGGSASAAAAATAAGLAAALVALDRTRREPRGRRLPGALLAAGLVLLAVACAVTPAAATSSVAAYAVLALRALGALVLVSLLTAWAQASVLGKVTGAIVAGVLAASVAAVSVIGTVVASSFAETQIEQARAAGTGRLWAMLDEVAQAQRAAVQVVRCASERRPCDHVSLFAGPHSSPLAAVVLRDGRVQEVDGTLLSPTAAAGLLAQDRVREVLDAPDAAPEEYGDVVRLDDGPARLAILGVAPVPGSQGGGDPADPLAGVFLVPLDSEVLQAGARLTGGFALSLVLNGSVVSSSLEPEEAAVLEQAVQESGRLDRPVEHPDGATVMASGRTPLVHLTALPLSDDADVALLAVSRDASGALAAERAALSRVVVAGLGLTLALAVAGVLVGRRLVAPVRRLTSTATRVTAGDLGARSGVSGRDEVGTLARAFDRMTASLSATAAGLRAAAQEEARLRADLETVLQSLSDAVVVTDEAGLVTRVNSAALAVLGAERDDAVRGRSLGEVLRLGDVDLTRVSEAQSEVVRPDGSRVPVAVAGSPLAGGGGHVVVIRDMTREREVERMKTEFLSNVSHELRTPLTPIRGYADLMRRRPGLTPEQSTLYAGAILESCLRLTRVVDLLVDVASLEAGRVVPELQSVDAAELLRDHVAQWRAARPERASDLRLHVERSLPRLSVDPFWVGRALDELVHNALQHTPPGTPVTLAAEARLPSRVALVVRDAGPGIRGEDRERVLGSFEQVDGSTTRTVGGLGLGLAFVRRLAEGFGLAVRLDSEPGQGTAVELLVAAERGSGLVPVHDGSHQGRSAPRLVARAGRPAPAPAGAGVTTRNGDSG